MTFDELINSFTEEESELLNAANNAGWILRTTQNKKGFEFYKPRKGISNLLLTKEDVIEEVKQLTQSPSVSSIPNQVEENYSLRPRMLIEKIRTDGGTQTRVQLNWIKITEYADLMRSGVSFDPVVVYLDGTDYWLADGFHRIQAATEANQTDIAVKVIHGTQRDAILYSLTANAKHGIQRTNEDKHNGVMILLKDSEWSQNSDSWIAEKAAVSQPFVSSLRRKLEAENGSLQPVRKSKTGRVMDTSRIGKKTQEVIEETKAAMPELFEPVIETKDEPVTPVEETQPEPQQKETATVSAKDPEGFDKEQIQITISFQIKKKEFSLSGRVGTGTPKFRIMPKPANSLPSGGDVLSFFEELKSDYAKTITKPDEIAAAINSKTKKAKGAK